VVVDVSADVLEVTVRGGGTLPGRAFFDVATSVATGELGSQLWSVTPQVLAEGAFSFAAGFVEELVYGLIPPDHKIWGFSTRSIWRGACRVVYVILFVVKLSLFIAAIPTMGAALPFYFVLEFLEGVICFFCNKYGRQAGQWLANEIRKYFAPKHVPDSLALSQAEKQTKFAAICARVQAALDNHEGPPEAEPKSELCLELGLCSTCSSRPCDAVILHSVEGEELGTAHPFCSTCVNLWVVEAKQTGTTRPCPGCRQSWDLKEDYCVFKCEMSSPTAIAPNPCRCSKASNVISRNPKKRDECELTGCEECYNQRFKSFKIKPL